MAERANLQRPETLRLRPATLADMERVFAWRNDPYIVARSSSGRTVTREEHQRWFSNALADPATLLYVIELDGAPAGQVRFERRGPASEAVISVYLLSAHAGKGHGRAAIRNACAEATRRWRLERVIAHVRGDNAPALRAFAASGFVPGADAGAPAGHTTCVYLT